MNKKKGLLSAFLAAALALSLFAGAVGAATTPDNNATLTVSKPDQFTTGVATEVHRLHRQGHLRRRVCEWLRGLRSHKGGKAGVL